MFTVVSVYVRAKAEKRKKKRKRIIAAGTVYRDHSPSSRPITWVYKLRTYIHILWIWFIAQVVNPTVHQRNCRTNGSLSKWVRVTGISIRFWFRFRHCRTSDRGSTFIFLPFTFSPLFNSLRVRSVPIRRPWLQTSVSRYEYEVCV